jgi:hypothetical protein
MNCLKILNHFMHNQILIKDFIPPEKGVVYIIFVLNFQSLGPVFCYKHSTYIIITFVSALLATRALNRHFV